MGGKDLVCVKQLRGSPLAQSDVQARLKKIADGVFSGDDGRKLGAAAGKRNNGGSSRGVLPGPAGSAAAWRNFRSPVIFNKDDIVGVHIRRGGVDEGQGHDEWLPTVAGAPDVISMAFVPITSLLTGVPGRGFLNHAINLYLRYKPPMEEFQQFLEFQVPRQWAPEFGELPLTLGPQRSSNKKNHKNRLPCLQFSLMGPKLRVNTARVDSGGRPVTGIRLFLEGKKNSRLGVHLQHLSVSPTAIAVATDAAVSVSDAGVNNNERAYFEPVRSPLLTHACTAPVQHGGARVGDDCAAAVVTAAWLEVREACLKKVLFLRLGFSGVPATRIRRSEWDGPLVKAQKSGSISALFSSRLSAAAATELLPVEGKVEVNSAVFPKGPPVPLPVQRMAKYVDTTEVTRGPDDLPGYWVVTGAKLCVEGGKVALKAKYSLLISVREEEDVWV